MTPESTGPTPFVRRERGTRGSFTGTYPPFWSYTFADGSGKGENLDYLAPAGAHKLKTIREKIGEIKKIMEADSFCLHLEETPGLTALAHEFCFDQGK